MGLIMDSDDDDALHAEARRESFCVFTDFGRESIEVEWRHLARLERIVEWLKQHAPAPRGE